MPNKHAQPRQPGKPLTAWIDGACPRNPGGPGGYGVAIYEGDLPLATISGHIPAGADVTNNLAEYYALAELLDWLDEHDRAGDPILVHSDSQLLVRQVWGLRGRRSHIKAGRPYSALALRTRLRVEDRPNISGRWVPREDNTEADELAAAGVAQGGRRTYGGWPPAMKIKMPRS